VAELRDRLQSALGDTYRVERELGGGGMSRVFLAQEVHLGRQVVVKVLGDGFEYESRRYRSLSAIAREVTGTRWNGLLFFGLAERRDA